MEIEEVIRNIRIGSGFSEISRDYIPRYSGIVRRTYIMNKNQIRLEYSSKGNIELGEGETAFYFHYDSFDSVIENARKFLKKPVSKWKNYNETWDEWYFPVISVSEMRESWDCLFSDFQERILEFPENFMKFSIKDFYARAVFLKMINPCEKPDFKNYINYMNNYSMKSDFEKYKEE